MPTTSQPLVSIITPVYNDATYLVECVESVLAQTYQNWDYTIVDNCSSDGSLEVARRYAAIDSRIRVHQNHHFLPAIANHSHALRQISPASKYCKVVLADDWIFPECIERMVTVAEKRSSVGLVSAYCLEDRQVTCTGLSYTSSVVSGQEICRQHLLNRLYLFGSPSCVLYRADLVRERDPFYSNANTHPDTEICFELLKSSDFGFVHQVLTFTRVRLHSLTTISASLQSNLAGMLHILLRHGPHYLTPQEFAICLTEHLSEYYRFLGKSLLLRREKGFWDYHKRQLIKSGLGFSRARLARAALATLCIATLNPKDTIQKLLKTRSTLSLVNAEQSPSFPF